MLETEVVIGKQSGDDGEEFLRGEHHLFYWSQDDVLESPAVGYAPLKSQTKQWAKESRIEGWFPSIIGENQCLRVIRCPEERTTRCREQSRHTWSELLSLCVWVRVKDATQSARLVAADAGCKTIDIRRTGEVYFDIHPHRRTRSETGGFADPSIWPIWYSFSELSPQLI